MEEAQTLVREARQAAGLSLRELARLAEVSFTTIRRIEAGETEPTLGTLRRILDAAGCRLRIAAEPSDESRPALGDLAEAMTHTPAGDRPDWTRLRAFLDYAARHPNEIARAITSRPHPTSRLMDALLAGIAEKLADDNQLPRPGWTHTAPKMRPEWTPPGTPRMRDQYRESAPRQLLERGLLIDESSLWRDRATVGV
jgi:transcriptional regulator with XRE-family HTH domain